jgi:hypothetical protein
MEEWKIGRLGGVERRENPKFSTGEDARFTFVDFLGKRVRVPAGVFPNRAHYLKSNPN